MATFFSIFVVAKLITMSETLFELPPKKNFRPLAKRLNNPKTIRFKEIYDYILEECEDKGISVNKLVLRIFRERYRDKILNRKKTA